MNCSFEELNLSDSILKALGKNGFSEPTAVQAQSIPILLQGQDLIAQAQTGTGKTAAFALPILQNIQIDEALPQVLILTPTRELAKQVQESFDSLTPSSLGLKTACLIGGQSFRDQKRILNGSDKHKLHVVIGTPGRIIDHINRGSLKLQQIKTIVLDEADEMLKMGFIDDVEFVLQQMPNNRQMALFSATMPERIAQIAMKYLKKPKHVKIKSKTLSAASVEQGFIWVENAQKTPVLTRILEVEEYAAAIVFVATKKSSEELARSLKHMGYRAKVINGDIPQEKRMQSVDDLKKGQIDILVATDVAARGLDIERVDLVINYDITTEAESYVHRVGRTGRAGRVGRAISLVNQRQGYLLNVIERKVKNKLKKLRIPSLGEITLKQNQKVLDKISNSLSADNLEANKKLISDYIEKNNHSLLDIAAALVQLNQRPALQKSLELPLSQSHKNRPRNPKAAFKKPGNKKIAPKFARKPKAKKRKFA